MFHFPQLSYVFLIQPHANPRKGLQGFSPDLVLHMRVDYKLVSFEKEKNCKYFLSWKGYCKSISGTCASWPEDFGKSVVTGTAPASACVYLYVHRNTLSIKRGESSPSSSWRLSHLMVSYKSVRLMLLYWSTCKITCHQYRT